MEKYAAGAKQPGTKVQKPSILRRLILAGAASAALGVTATAQATPLTPTGWASTPNGYENFSIVFGPPPIAKGVPAGGFKGVFGPDNILFWCYELDQYFSFNPNPPYDYVATAVSDPANTALSELFTEVGGPFNATSSDLYSAAFQLAVWEIKYDAGGPYDIFSGNFKVTSNPDATTAQAQTWLNNLPSIQGYTITLLHSDTNQDFIMGRPKPPSQQAPEPFPVTLLGAGLAAMIFAMRRRSGRQV